MAKSKHTAEQIVEKLRQAEVVLAQGVHPGSEQASMPSAPETVLPWPSGYATLYPEVVAGLG